MKDAATTDTETIRSLISAAAAALRRRVDLDDDEDVTLVTRGVFILNRWGNGPRIGFEYIGRGPLSEAVYRCITAMHEEGSIPPTDVPPEDVDRLSGILGKGSDFACAYCNLIWMGEMHPLLSPLDVVNATIGRGYVPAESVMEAASWLAMPISSTPAT